MVRTPNISQVTFSVAPDTDYQIVSGPAGISDSGVHTSLFVGDVMISLGFGPEDETLAAIDRLAEHLAEARARFIADVAALGEAVPA